ncbi:MAG: hypothetical protein PsegKO_08560 [Pseudohongiellaceae bacterium]
MDTLGNAAKRQYGSQYQLNSKTGSQGHDQGECPKDYPDNPYT